MADQFTQEELMEVIRGARTFNACFSEEEMETLTRLQRRLADSGFLEAVNTLLKLEEERGKPLQDIYQLYEGLVQETQEMDRTLVAKYKELDMAESRLEEVKQESQQAIEARDQAKGEQEEIKRQQNKESRKLSDYKKRADMEKRKIDDEVAEYRRQAGVSKEDVGTAGHVKAEVEKHGFTLDLALGLAGEFAGYADAREKLAEGLKKHGSFTKHLAALYDEIRSRQDQERWLKESISSLSQEETAKKASLSELDAEIANKTGLVDFYYRYVGLQPLIDYLASGNGVMFYHCQWCGALFWVVHAGGMRAGMVRCPWCSLTMVEPDRKAYAAVSQPPGTPLKLLP